MKEIRVKCKRCNGFMLKDEDGDASCIRCGGVVVLQRRYSTVPFEWQKKPGAFVRPKK